MLVILPSPPPSPFLERDAKYYDDCVPFVCHIAYLRNYTAEFDQIFVHVVCGQLAVARFCSGDVAIRYVLPVFVYVVYFSHNVPYDESVVFRSIERVDVSSETSASVPTCRFWSVMKTISRYSLWVVHQGRCLLYTISC